MIKNFETKVRDEHAIRIYIRRLNRILNYIIWKKLRGVFLDQNVKYVRRVKNHKNSLKTLKVLFNLPTTNIFEFNAYLTKNQFFDDTILARETQSKGWSRKSG